MTSSNLQAGEPFFVTMDRDIYAGTSIAETAAEEWSEAAETKRPQSPCIRVCTLDDKKTCLGCGRTLEEIVAWPRMTPAEQLELLAELGPRRDGGGE